MKSVTNRNSVSVWAKLMIFIKKRCTYKAKVCMRNWSVKSEDDKIYVFEIWKQKLFLPEFIYIELWIQRQESYQYRWVSSSGSTLFENAAFFKFEPFGINIFFRKSLANWPSGVPNDIIVFAGKSAPTQQHSCFFMKSKASKVELLQYHVLLNAKKDTGVV